MATANLDGRTRDSVADENSDLTRKRQKLSEELESTTPLPVDGSGSAEALTPNEGGTSVHNATALHNGNNTTNMNHNNNMASASASFLDGFNIGNDPRISPVAQLQTVLDQLPNSHIQPKLFIKLSIWLGGHLKETKDKSLTVWQEGYTVEGNFFSLLADLSINILRHGGEIFRRFPVALFEQLKMSLATFVDDLATLSTRIILILPQVIDRATGRRDSSAHHPKSQHTIKLLRYVHVLAQILVLYDTRLAYVKETFDFDPESTATYQRGKMSSDSAFMSAVSNLLQRLAETHNEIDSAWEGINALLHLLNALHTTAGIDAVGDIDQAMMVIHCRLLPAICTMSPRALPTDCHEVLIQTAGKMLTLLAQRADLDLSVAIYTQYIKSDSDALLADSMVTSIGRALHELSNEKTQTLVGLLRTAWNLQALKMYIFSSIMDVRSSGVLQLSALLLQLYSTLRTSPNGLNHPILQYAGRFMRANELTKYIFGPESHASLISHSQNIIGFLAATFLYTDVETDLIWAACTTSVEAEFVKASFGVLAELCHYLDLDRLLYLVKKYANTSPERLGKDAVETLADLFQSVQLKTGVTQDQDRRLTTAFISIDILCRLRSANHSPSMTQLRDTARKELLRFTTAEHTADDRIQIYRRCRSILLKRGDCTTTSIEILLQFLDSSTVCLMEPQNLLSVVSVGALIEELIHFVDTCRTSGAQADTSAEYAIECRINAIVCLQALTEVPESVLIWTTFSDYTIGKLAVNNTTRDCAWRTLTTITSFKSVVGATAGAILRHCREEAISLPLDFLTPTLLGVFGNALRQSSESSHFQDDYSIVLRDPIWLKLVRVAESPNFQEASALARKIVCDILFEYPGMHCDNSGVAKCHADFARTQIESIRQNFLTLAGSSAEKEAQDIIQKIDLLADVFRRSICHGATSRTELASDVFLAKDSTAVAFTCRLEVYVGGQAQPKLYHLQVTSTTKLSELVRKLPEITGADANRIVISGKVIDLDSQGDCQMSQLGIGLEAQASGVISVCPVHTIKSDIGLLFRPADEVEAEILAQYAELEKLLDGPEKVAQKMFTFIVDIRAPLQPRQRVSIVGPSVQELFPSGRTWRSAFTIHMLKTQLQDYARLGVIDETFRLHGIGLLVGVIIDQTRPIEPEILGRAMDCLVWFLRERPTSPSTVPIIKPCSEFVSRMVDVCDFFLCQPPELSAVRRRMIGIALGTLIEAFRCQPSTWQAFTQHASVVDMHRRAFMHSDISLVGPITKMISDFCVDATTSDEVADFYMKTALAILPYALKQQEPAMHFFDLTTRVLLANRLLGNDEVGSREICESLVTLLQTYEHSESVELPLIDLKMAGLLGILNQAVAVVQSFKRPLNMGGLAVKIFTTLLFPPSMDHTSRPLIDDTSRGFAYELVESTCESQADFLELVVASSPPMQDTANDAGQIFPGKLEWLRPASQCSGLANLGMTCYMNSLLQQLFANVHFRKFIFDIKIIDRNQQELLLQLQCLFARMQSDYSIVSDPRDLAKVLGTQTDSQEDVHGFYEDFIAKLETNMPDEVSRLALARFFSGALISQIKGECGHVSTQTEPFVDLQMIVKNKASLLDSLQEFVQGEPMEGTNKYKCLSCVPNDGGGRLVNAMRRACPEKVPDNLTFCLKRFSFESMYGSESKVNDRFEFPQTIDMSRWHRAHLDDPTISIDRDPFELVGVIVHQGSLQLGHYWSYTLLRNTGLPNSRTWVKLEDRIVSPCQGGIEEVQQECFGGLHNNGQERADNAYVLFYQRKACLEEQISLPGPVQDPVTLSLLPPKVAIPHELQELIDSTNRWRNRVANLFDDDFHEHILWLLSNYNYFSPQSPSHDSSTSENSQSSEPSQGQGQFEDETVKQLSELAASYLKRVAACDSSAVSRLDRCIGILKHLITTHTRFSVCVLDNIASDQTWLTGVILRCSFKIREKLLDFVLFSLSRVREQDEMRYKSAFRQIMHAHSQVKDTTDPATLHWRLYLLFAEKLSQLGSWERTSVLDAGYLTWVFEILCTPFASHRRQKFPNLLEHLEKNSIKVTALYDFLRTMLGTRLVLPPEDVQYSDHHITADGGLILTEADIVLISKCSRSEEAIWMSCARFADHECDWKKFAPGRFLASLMSPENPPEIKCFITTSIEKYIFREEFVLGPLMHLVLHFCSVSTDENAIGAFKIFGKVIHQWDRSERSFLQVAREAHKYTPCAVVSSIEYWVNEFMSSPRVDTRVAVASWLREVIFEPNCISDYPQLDAMRVRQTRKIVHLLTPRAMAACEGGFPRTKHESTIEILLAAENYLQEVQTAGKVRSQSSDEQMRASISAPLRVELAELGSELAELRSFREAQEGWETDEPLQMSRTSLKDDSEEETTTESEMDDDLENAGLFAK